MNINEQPMTTNENRMNIEQNPMNINAYYSKAPRSPRVWGVGRVPRHPRGSQTVWRSFEPKFECKNVLRWRRDARWRPGSFGSFMWRQKDRLPPCSLGTDAALLYTLHKRELAILLGRTKAEVAILILSIDVYIESQRYLATLLRRRKNGR